MKRKKLIYLVILLSAVILTACGGKKVSPLPAAPVSIHLDLTSAYSDFKVPFQYLTFMERDERIGVYSVGYGGVLLYIDINSKYCAFDMACTYEKEPNVRVYPDSTNLSAVCKKCGSKFNLAWGFGEVEAGPATEHLQPYRTSIAPSMGSNILHVFP